MRAHQRPEEGFKSPAEGERSARVVLSIARSLDSTPLTARYTRYSVHDLNRSLTDTVAIATTSALRRRRPTLPRRPFRFPVPYLLQQVTPIA
ncbi:unnamed protein product [Danaus chrysippus]|uniref:(African queen) hypothetical protein n=1 Tax=Danaus chrysippus TaxID=151541 RepID=A0A8J2QHN9_9NEOP|nr:unnamed protein product [Danaus chrysippus]